MPALLAIPLVIILAALVSYGLSTTLRGLSGGFVGWLAGAIANVPFVGVAVSEQAVKLTRWLSHALGSAFEGLAEPVTRWIGALAQYTGRIAEASLLWPIELFRLMTWLVSTKIPALIRALPTRIEHVVHGAVKIVHETTKTIVRETKVVVSKAHTVVVQEIPWRIRRDFPALDWLRIHLHALTAVLPHALPIPFGRTIAQIKKRLRALEHERLGALTFAGAVAVALSRLGISWVRCNNVKRVGRNLCGLSPRAITDLLGLLADWLILTNVCRVFTLLQQGLGVVQPEITAFITAAETWACYGDNEHPPRIVVPSLDLPAAVGVSGLPV